MEEVLKQDKSKSHKEFEKLLSEDMQKRAFREGEITTGIVEEVGKKFVIVDLKMKSSGSIPVSEFGKNLDKISRGDKIQVLLERIENRAGEVVISHEKAARLRSWKSVIEKYNKKEEIVAQIIQRTKGGFICEYNSVLCFLPASQLALAPVENVSKLMHVPLNFAIVKVDDKRKNIVLSRRECLMQIREKDKIEKMKGIKEGVILKDCVAKSIQSWGIFYTYKTLDLLVHVNELSWSRVSAPGDLVKVGQTNDILVYKIEGTKISGSLKRLQPDTFLEAAKKYKPGDTVENCTVQSLKEYGAFVEIAPNLIGLLHSSEIDHLNKNVRPSSVLAVSQKISCKILSLSTTDRKLSLSYKDCFESPWVSFEKNYKKNQIVKVKVKNKNDYAIYGYIDDTPIVAMLHRSNLVWDIDKADEELAKFHKNDILECKIYDIDIPNTKVQLTKKHMQSSPYDWLKDERYKVESLITVTCKSLVNEGLWVYVDAKKDIKVLIKKNQLFEKTFQTSRFTPGSKIDAMIIECKPEKLKLVLSVKAAEKAETQAQIKKYGARDSGAVLGDILGKALKTKSKKKKK